MKEYDDLAEWIKNNYKNCKIVEIGIGSFFYLYKRLKNMGLKVLAVDINPKSDFIIKDDVFNPNYAIYRGAKLIYSIRPPPEIVPYIVSLAEKIGADVLIKPLYGDFFEGFKIVNHKKASFCLKHHKEIIKKDRIKKQDLGF